MSQPTTILEQAAALSAKAKFDRVFKNNEDKEPELKRFLTKLWKEQKPKLFAHASAAGVDDYRFAFDFQMPKDLPFSEDDVKVVFREHIDDFKSLKRGLVVLLVPNTERTYRVVILYETEHNEAFAVLKEKRKDKLRRSLDEKEEEPDAKKVKKEVKEEKKVKQEV